MNTQSYCSRISALLSAIFMSSLWIIGCAGSSNANADGDGDADGDIDGDTDGDSDGDEPQELEIGQVIELETNEAGALEMSINTPTGGEKFILVLHSAQWDGRAAPVEYEIQVEGQEELSYELRPFFKQPRHPWWISKESRPSIFESHLPIVARALAEGRATPAMPRPDPPPDVGETRDFWVIGTSLVQIEALAVRISDTTAFWLDISSDPPAEISDSDLDEIASQYEEIILPREHRFFGEESDVDENGLIFVLLSGVVHEYNSTVAYVTPCDLVGTGVMGCTASNETEVLYLTPPNVIEHPLNTPRAILEIMSHETNHMIFFNTKYIQHGNTGHVENAYLLEGLAALAQDLSGYQSGNLFVAWYGLNEILDMSAWDILHDEGQYVLYRDATLRGGAYLLMRYLYDRAGGSAVHSDGTFEDLGGITFSRDVHNLPTTGLAGLTELLDESLEEVVYDFYTALVLTNRGSDNGPISDEPHFNYLPTQVDPVTERQRGFDAYASLPMGTSMTGPATVTLDTADGLLRTTGVEYIELVATGDETLTVQIRDSAGDGELRARLARIE